jgi:hypothetical protein
MVKKKRKMVFTAAHIHHTLTSVGLDNNIGASGLMMPFTANKTCNVVLEEARLIYNEVMENCGAVYGFLYGFNW